LLALMLFHDSRRHTRTGAQGELVLLSEQDRSRWDAAEISEGVRVLNRALRLRRPGRYQVEAAIAALHAEAPSADQIDWPQIAALYEQLLLLLPSPVVALNRAVAVAETGRLDQALALVDEIEGLERYHLLHAARADLLRRLGRFEEASEEYRRAVELTPDPAEEGVPARAVGRSARSVAPPADERRPRRPRGGDCRACLDRARRSHPCRSADRGRCPDRCRSRGASWHRGRRGLPSRGRRGA